jgi:hypothetical protein
MLSCGHGAVFRRALRDLIRIMQRTALLFSALFVSMIAPVWAQETVHWVGSYKEALQEAKRTRKPIFLEFRCEA